MQDTDRYNLDLPALVITKMKAGSDGVAHLETFFAGSGLHYDGLTLEMVVKIQFVLEEALRKLTELSLPQDEDGGGKPPKAG